MCLQGRRKEVDILSFCHFCTLWPPSLPCTGGRNRWVLFASGQAETGWKEPCLPGVPGWLRARPGASPGNPPVGVVSHMRWSTGQSLGGWTGWGEGFRLTQPPRPPHLLPTWLRPRRLLPGGTCTQHGILGSDLQPLTQCRGWEVRLQTRQTGFKPQLCHPLDRELGVIPLTSYGVMIAPALRISTRIKCERAYKTALDDAQDRTKYAEGAQK